MELSDINKIFEMQHDLQAKISENCPCSMTTDESIEFIRNNVLAATAELHEALDETGWKPWATSRHINRDAFKSELVDVLKFYMNLMIVTEITWEEIIEGFHKKHKVNFERLVNGYDGVSTKCPGCKRALDDEHVTCEVTPNGYHCTVTGITHRT